MKNRAKPHISPPKWLFTIALITAVQFLATSNAIPQQSQRNGVTLHEYFNPAQRSVPTPTTASAGAQAPQPSATSTPPHIPGQPPALSLEISDDEPILTGEGPLFDTPLKQPNGPLDPRSAANQLDDLTDHVDPLQYFPQFDPSIIPYKRQVVQNHVSRTPDGSYLVELVSNTYTNVAIPASNQLQKSPTEDAFWGSFIIRAEPGERHPIPSVSPDQRILRIETEPAANLTIVRDQADNFYIQTTYSGLIRVNLQIAAPRFYFDGELNKTVRWTDFPTALRPSITPEIRTTANRVLSQLAVNRQQTPHDALLRLIEHFRDFESRALPQSAHTGDMFETIALGKVGVCRHRSHAFIITAHALGIPTRYVYNETHAFVEVYWPAQGWRRIDLGGAAENVDIRDHNQNRPLHDGTRVDPLPQPPAYLSEIDRILNSSPQPPETSESSETSNTPEAPEITPNTPEITSDTPQIPTTHTASEITETTEIPTPTQDTRHTTTLTITSANPNVLRGQAISLEGLLTTSQGTPLPNHPIQILLGPAGATTPESTTLLGTTQTNTLGQFSGQFPIPPDLSIGRWTLTATFPGTPELQPATSQ